jgi:hypothetical protein
MNKTLDLEPRLDALARKVKKPLRQLLDVGQLGEDARFTILDAADLSGDPFKLVGFTVGYLDLKSQSIAIDDVIRMAKDQNRPIKLDWRPKRWQHEHQ